MFLTSLISLFLDNCSVDTSHPFRFLYSALATRPMGSLFKTTRMATALWHVTPILWLHFWRLHEQTLVISVNLSSYTCDVVEVSHLPNPVPKSWVWVESKSTKSNSTAASIGLKKDESCSDSVQVTRYDPSFFQITFLFQYLRSHSHFKLKNA